MGLRPTNRDEDVRGSRFGGAGGTACRRLSAGAPADGAKPATLERVFNGAVAVRADR
jgi:hypothetical protein